MPPQPPRVVVSAVLATRRRLQRTADALVPPHFVLLEKTFGLAATHVIAALAELGVADHLADGPRTAQELAARLDVDADVLHRVLRVAAVHDIVHLDRRGRFRLTRIGQTLRSDHEHSVRPWTRYMGLKSTTSAWADLLESVRTGRSAFPRVHGRSVWTHFAEHPEEGRLFDAAMRRITQEDLPVIVGGYPWPESGTVCDVAGGVGTLLAGILEARPGLRGVLVDAPEVLAEAEDHLTHAGVRARVELSPGDMFERIDAKADVYLLKDVLHDWDDAACARILNTVRATTPDGAKVVLVETLQERNDPHPIASIIDLQMLTQCDDGRQRSVAELHALLDDAGFAPGEVRRTAGFAALVEGVAV